MAYAWVSADDLDDPTLTDAVEAARAASSILWALSGRKYGGVVSATEEYACKSPVGLSVGTRTALCRTHDSGWVRLRGKPVRTVYEVVVNPGTASQRLIPADEYEIVDRTFIRPTPGATWTACNKLRITYAFGAMPPEAGRRAARLLANQLVKARIDPDNCQLPDRVTSVSRQGLSMTILDPQDFLKEGRTGIYEVDLFLKAVNPDNARKRARVFSPDFKRGVRVTPSVAGAHDLVITPPYTFTKTFLWETNGDPTTITDNWEPSALVKDADDNVIFDLTPYLTVEPDSEEGRMDLVLPPSVTSVWTHEGSWDLTMTNLHDPGLVIHLLGGAVSVKTD